MRVGAVHALPETTRYVRPFKAIVLRRGVLEKDFLLQVEDGLGEVGGAAKVAPVVFVGAEGQDFFALGGKAEVGVDDGEDALFGEHGEEAGGDDVDEIG